MMPSLSLRVSQSLTLTPQLQQSIRLLQLSTQELTQEVEHRLGRLLHHGRRDRNRRRPRQASRRHVTDLGPEALAAGVHWPGHPSSVPSGAWTALARNG